METFHTEVQALVARLNNLSEIFRVQGEILAYGEATVEPLAELLLSPPSTFPEPRVAAAECLGVIGTEKAVEALIRVLDYHGLRNLGPVQRLAEETVRNAAAQRLARFHHARVVNALLSSLKRDHLIGAGEALAVLGETAAIPYLIECLEDDVKKYRATDALLSFGQQAVPYLECALSQSRLVEGAEPPLSQERRSRVAELLGQLKARNALSTLENGLHDASGLVRIACALSLIELEGAEAKEAIPQLIAGLEDSDFLVRMNCEEALLKIGKAAVPLLSLAASGYAFDLPCRDEARLAIPGRTASIKLLGNLGGTEAITHLMVLLGDPEETVRHQAVSTLGNLLQDRVVCAALKRVVRSDTSRRVRAAARMTLESKPGKTGTQLGWFKEKIFCLNETVSTVKRFLMR